MYNRELIPNFQWIKLPFLPYVHFFLFYVITNWWYMSPNRCWHWNYCNNFFNCFYTISVVKNMSDKYAKMFRLKCLEYNVRISCRIIHKDYWLWDVAAVWWLLLQENMNIMYPFLHNNSFYIYCPKLSFQWFFMAMVLHVKPIIPYDH